MEFLLLFYHFTGTGDILKIFTGGDTDQVWQTYLQNFKKSGTNIDKKLTNYYRLKT